MLEAGQVERNNLVIRRRKKRTTKLKESDISRGPKNFTGPDADGGISTKYWFWGAEFPVTSQQKGPAKPKEKPQSQPIKQTAIQEDPQAVVSKILIENPGISAATFVNVLKSKGLKIDLESKQEADGVSSNVAVVRDQKESNRFVESIRFEMVESAEPQRNGVGPTRFKTILLREGLGNAKDGFFYTRECLEKAIPVFEGQQMFADHPDALEEKTRPERSVRDLIGHFENLRLEEADDGSALLVGESVLLPDKENEWARSRVLHATDFNKKFPDKDFVALSINANGGAEEMEVGQFLSSYNLSDSARVKINKAIEKGLSSVKVVNGFDGSFSCDLVTKAGAGGKVVDMIESNKKMESFGGLFGKKKEAGMEEGGPGSGRRKGGGKGPQNDKGAPKLSSGPRQTTAQYKAWKQDHDASVARGMGGAEIAKVGREFNHTGYYHEPYKGGGHGLSMSFDSDKDANAFADKVKSHPLYTGHSVKAGGPNKSSIVKVGFKPKHESQSKGELMSDKKKEAEGHDDEQQDIELIKSMLKKHGADGKPEGSPEGEGDDSQEEADVQEADMQMCKEMYQAYKEMGYEQKEALEAAGHALKLAKHMGKKHEVAEAEEAEESDDEQEESHKEADDSKVESLRKELLQLKGTVAKFTEAEKTKEVLAHLETVLEKSKLPNTVTKSFRESLGTPKSKEQVDKDFKIFMEGFKSQGGEATSGNIFIPEKTIAEKKEGSSGFADCLR